MPCDFCYCTCLYSVGDAAEVRKIDVLIVAEHVCRGVADELKLVLVSAPDALHERGEGVPARVRRERPDARDGLNRGGKLVAEVRWVARFIPALARPHDKATGIKYSIEAARFLLPRRFNAILGK